MKDIVYHFHYNKDYNLRSVESLRRIIVYHFHYNKDYNEDLKK